MPCGQATSLSTQVGLAALSAVIVSLVGHFSSRRPAGHVSIRSNSFAGDWVMFRNPARKIRFCRRFVEPQTAAPTIIGRLRSGPLSGFPVPRPRSRDTILSGFPVVLHAPPNTRCCPDGWPAPSARTRRAMPQLARTSGSGELCTSGARTSEVLRWWIPQQQEVSGGQSFRSGVREGRPKPNLPPWPSHPSTP